MSGVACGGYSEAVPGPGCPEQQRVACALGGVYTALSIDRVLPILHCGPGCVEGMDSVLANANGGQNPARYLESALPCTNFCDADVVFGGTGRLRDVTERTLLYYDADLFLVAGGCTSEIIGDDIEEVAAELTTDEKPVLYVHLPGFAGNNLTGHSRVLHALIEQYVARRVPPGSAGAAAEDAGAAAPLVNVLGIVPHYDTMWAATLEKLAALLAEIGLRPNILYGRGATPENLLKIPSAAFNLVLAPWTDLDIAEKLQEMYGTPFLHHPNVPIGPTEEARFIRAVTAFAGADEERSERVIRERAARYDYYIDRDIVWIFEMHNKRSLPHEFFVNASAAAALSLTKFLAQDLGMTPRRVFIPEDVPEERRDAVAALFTETERTGLARDDIVFTDDGGAFEQHIRGVDQEVRKSVVFGSVWDDLVARKLNMPFVPVSAPYGDILVGDRTYFGTEGAIGLISDIYNDAARKSLMNPML
jgi:nitrogenase molybdenum-iron protein beta chain